VSVVIINESLPSSLAAKYDLRRREDRHVTTIHTPCSSDRALQCGSSQVGDDKVGPVRALEALLLKAVSENDSSKLHKDQHFHTPSHPRLASRRMVVGLLLSLTQFCLSFFAERFEDLRKLGFLVLSSGIERCSR
jgi:hypothetical protein